MVLHTMQTLCLINQSLPTSGKSRREISARHPTLSDDHSMAPAQSHASRIDRLIGVATDLDHNLNKSEQEDGDDCLPCDDSPALEAAAQSLFRDHIFALFSCMLSGLTTLMYVPSIVSVLNTTGLSANPVGSFVRYLSTLNHVIEWFKNPDAGVRSLRKVRSIHSKVNRLSKDETGQKMTQFDMVVTQWAFFGPAFIFTKEIGLAGVTDRELEGLVHKLYQIGFMLGVSDEFNLCSGTLSDVRQYCRDIHQRVILPCLMNPSPLSVEMAQSMLKGAGLITPPIYVDAYEAWTFKLYQAASWRDKVSKIETLRARLIFHVHCFVFDVLLVWYPARLFFRSLINPLMRLNIALANRWKARIIRENREKFETTSVVKFWKAQTDRHKDVATTVGEQWQKFARRKRKESQVMAETTEFWKSQTERHKVMGVTAGNQWQKSTGKTRRENQIKLETTEFWKSQTEKHKGVMTTVGEQWLDFTLKNRKENRILFETVDFWRSQTEKHKGIASAVWKKWLKFAVNRKVAEHSF